MKAKEPALDQRKCPPRTVVLRTEGRTRGHTYGPSNTLAQAANSTIFQEMAPLLMCTYSTMEGCPLHMVSAMKMALKF